MAKLHLPVFTLSARVVNELMEGRKLDDSMFESIIQWYTSSSNSSSYGTSTSKKQEAFEGVEDWIIRETSDLSVLHTFRILSRTANELSFDPLQSSPVDFWTSFDDYALNSVLALLIEKRLGNLFTSFWNIPTLRISLGWPFGRKSLIGEVRCLPPDLFLFV